ncbi:MAG TPA: dihydrofolate reductase family protein [Dehalococcoidia bacterium]|nr:dihydrofolate reductase family protein [Dehalococcoidia bacterium]
MDKVTCSISMSLDGFIAGPNDRVGNGLGDGGDRLHEWVYDLESWRKRHNLSGGEAHRDSEVLEETFKDAGAVVMGRRMFDLGEEPWGDNPPFHMPVFVVTHNPRDKLVKEGGTTFTFVNGVEQALVQAWSAAGNKDVSVAGGANVIQQLITAGLLHEIQIHLVPVMLGTGRRLFEDMGQIDFECTRVIESPAVTHLRFQPRR